MLLGAMAGVTLLGCAGGRYATTPPADAAPAPPIGLSVWVNPAMQLSALDNGSTASAEFNLRAETIDALTARGFEVVPDSWSPHDLEVRVSGETGSGASVTFDSDAPPICGHLGYCFRRVELSLLREGIVVGKFVSNEFDGSAAAVIGPLVREAGGSAMVQTIAEQKNVTPNESTAGVPAPAPTEAELAYAKSLAERAEQLARKSTQGSAAGGTSSAATPSAATPSAATPSPAAWTAGAPPAAATSPAAVTPTVASASSPAAAAMFVLGSPQPAAYALIVGIERYRDLPSPTGARTDAETFARLAVRSLGVPEENIRVAYDDRATRVDVDKQLRWLKHNVPVGGRIYFFFSGHGAPDPSTGTSYLIPYDGDPSSLEDTGLRLGGVLESLTQTKARDVVAIVDSCFSGAGGRSVLPAGARPLVPVKVEKARAKLVLLTAVSGAQISGPVAGKPDGLFTHHLTQALGGGMADLDGDRQITVQELFDWVKPRVARDARRDNREQTPALIVGSGSSGDFVITSGISPR